MLLCNSGNTALLAVQWADAKQPRHQEECLCMSADLQTWLAVIVPGILPGARSDHQVPAEMSCKQQQQLTAVGMTLCMPLPEPAETALAHLPLNSASKVQLEVGWNMGRLAWDPVLPGFQLGSSMRCCSLHKPS